MAIVNVFFAAVLLLVGVADVYGTDCGYLWIVNGDCCYCHIGKYMTSNACCNCPAGQFNDRADLRSMFTRANSCKNCPSGRYQPNTFQTDCFVCSKGKFSTGGAVSCTDCPRGQFQDDQGSGGCHSCPRGRFSNARGATECTACPSGQFVNTRGARSCKNCPRGEHAPSNGRRHCIQCPRGRVAGDRGSSQCSECPSGRFQPSQGEESCRVCPAGYFQPSVGQSGCRSTDAGYYATSDSSSQTKCPPGRFSSTPGATDSSCDGPCVAGRYCQTSGLTSPTAGSLCPAGRFGRSGETDPQCTGECPAGFYCPKGTGSRNSANAPRECGSITNYCPSGSASPRDVEEGYFTVPEDSDVDVRESQQKCPSGSYCKDGERFLCPTGRYGSAEGITDETCSGVCQDGYHCPPGSSSPREQTCSDSDPEYYCVDGEKFRCGDDSYTVPETPDTSTRTGCKKCSDEFVCEGGLRQTKTQWIGKLCSQVSTRDTMFVREVKEPVNQDTAIGNTVLSAEVRVPWEELNYKVKSLVQDGRTTAGGTCTKDLSDDSPLQMSTFDVERTFGDGNVPQRDGRLQVKAGETLAYSDCDHYEITVAVELEETNGPSLSSECSFGIDVEFVNSDPIKKEAYGDIDQPLRFEAFRGSSFAEPVGDQLVDMFVDPDGSELTFTLADEEKDPVTQTDHPFSIGACTGQIEVADPQMLLETEHTSFTFHVLVSDNFPDNPGEILQTVIIDVVQPNRAPRVGDNLPEILVVERSEPGTRVYTSRDPKGEDISTLVHPAFVTDPDKNQVFVELAPCRSTEFYCDAFDLSPTGELRVNNSDFIDFDSTAPVVRLLRVKYTDRIADPVSATLGVRVRELREAPIVTRTEFEYPEKATGFLGQLSADDITGDAFKYTVHGIRSNQRPKEDRVSVFPNGTIFVSEEFRSITCGVPEHCGSCEPIDKWVEINVSARVLDRTDDKPGPLESTITPVHVKIQLVNERARFVPPSFDVTVEEDRDDVVVLDLSSNYCDREGDQLLYQLVSTAGFSGHFVLDALNGLLRVQRGEAFNYENVQNGTVSVEVKDTKGNARVDEIEVYIVDRPEAPHVVTSRLQVDELTTNADGAFGEIEVQDPDVLSGSGRKYASAASEMSFYQLSLTDLFFLSSSGNVRVAKGYVPNYETLVREKQNALNLDLEVVDLVNNVSTKASIAIEVLDVSEPPVFDPPVQNFSLNIHVEAGDVLGTVDGDPIDFDDTLVYEYVDGPSFLVLSSSGTLSYASNSSNTQEFTTDDVGKEFSFWVRLVDSTNLKTDGKHNIRVINEPKMPEWSGATSALTEGETMVIHMNEHHKGVFEGFQLECTDPNEKGVQYQLLDARPGVYSDVFRLIRESGKLEVLDASRLDFESLYRSEELNGTFTVACVDTFGLRTEGTVIVNIDDVAEPPTITSIPEDGVFSAPEDWPMGTILEQIEAYDEDIGSQRNLQFVVEQVNHSTVPIEVHTARYEDEGHTTIANITLKAPLDFYEQRLYDLRVTVKDETNLADSSHLQFEVVEVNDPPIFDKGMFHISVYENVSKSDTLATEANFPFWDRNRDQSHRYEVTWSEPPNLLTFRVGEILQLDTDVLNYETKPEHNFGIKVIDDGGKSDEANVTLEVLHVNDMIVARVEFAPHDPHGGSPVTFFGEDLGPIWKDVSVFALGRAPGGGMVLESNCARQFNGRHWNNSFLTCIVPPGVGQNVKWTIHASQDTKLAPTATRYKSPNITRVQEWPEEASTAGGEQFVLRGVDFGPPTLQSTSGTNTITPVAVFYRSKESDVLGSFEAADCELQDNAEDSPAGTVKCRTIPGAATQMEFKIVVGHTISEWSTESPWFSPVDSIGYAPPVIESVSPLVANFPTTGVNEAFYLLGRHYGIDRAPFHVQMSNSWIQLDVSCHRQNHTVMLCDLPEGIDTHFTVTVTVDKQGSVPSPKREAISYDPPRLHRVADTSDERPRDLSTQGGETVFVEGDNFGPGLYEAISVFYGKHLQYEASQCSISREHTMIECLTVPGVGKNHSWRVQIGNQSSNVLFDISNYHPPVVATYTRPNASVVGVVSDLRTEGGELVTLQGRHFGPEGTPVDSAVYGEGNQTFVAENCDVLGHKEMRCITAPGAGSAHFWTVTIGNQESTLSTTSYAPPIINGFKGVNGSNPKRLKVTGEEPVLLLGNNFGPPSMSSIFLTSVTYGPRGQEYSARDCEVITHDNILCYTTEGHGQNHVWKVEIAGQLSSLSKSVTSYAPPEISSLDPRNGSTSGTEITITGTNFGTSIVGATAVTVYADVDGMWNRMEEHDRLPDISRLEELLSLQQDDPSSWINRAHKDLGFLPEAVQEWINSIHALTVRITDMRWLSEELETITLQLPSGFGIQRPIFLRVGATMSLPVFFDYKAPYIGMVSPRQLPGGKLKITVTGNNFCGGQSCAGTSCCGRLFLEDELKKVSDEQYDHTSITITVDAGSLPRKGRFRRGSVRVSVLDQPITSNSFTFDNPPPDIPTQKGKTQLTGFNTEGGETFTLVDVQAINDQLSGEEVTVLVGGKECTNVTVEGEEVVEGIPFGDISCILPPNIGKDLPVSVSIQGLESPPHGTTVSYASPVICFVELKEDGIILFKNDKKCEREALPDEDVQDERFGLPTQGGAILIHGRNLGSSDLNIETLTQMISSASVGQGEILSHNHDLIELALPEGAGNADITLRLADLEVSFGIGFAPPNLDSIRARSRPRGVPSMRVLEELTGIPTLPGPEDIIYLSGENFGPPGSTNISVFFHGSGVLGDGECAVVFSNHTDIACIPPAGQGDGVDVEVIVEGQSDTVDDMVQYGKAVVADVTPSSGPTTGKTSGGFPVNVTVYGENFGVEGQVVLGTAQKAAPVQNPVFNHTMVSFQLPEGVGESLTLRVLVSHWKSPEQSYSNTGSFSYNPPKVDSVYRLTDGLTGRKDCEPFERCTSFQGEEQCFLEYPDCFPTTGGVPIEITGENFGPAFADARVEARIGDRLCPTLSPKDLPNDFSHHHSFFCELLPGVGSKLPVQVSVDGRRPVENGSFSYDPPRIRTVMPNNPDAQGEEIEIRGANFGPAGGTVSVGIGNLTCLYSEVLGHERVVCSTQRDTVGPKRIELNVAHRQVVFPAGLEYIVTECKPGWYGLQGELCVDCEKEERGAVCPGGERFIDLVYSEEGFWRHNVTTPESRCHELRQSRDRCPLFLPCQPSWACAGDNECSEGYTGFRCSDCVAGSHFRINGVCQKCPNHAWLLGVGLILAAMGACIGAYIINSKGIRLGAFTIGIDYFQVLALFARTRVRWPTSMERLLQALSFFNFNLELAAPDCYMKPPPPYEVRWMSIMVVPLLAGGLLGVVYVSHYLYKLLVLKRPAGQRHTHVNALIATMVVIMYILYVFLTRMTLDVFNCAPTDPPDGNLYMAGRTDIKCFESSVHTELLLPLGIVALLVYVLSLPIGAIVLLRRNKEGVKQDQILRAHNVGNSRFTNPQYTFRRRYQRLYHLFRPGKWYWVLAILLRKFMIALTSLMFNASPIYQLSMALLVMFTAFAVHVRHQPYMSKQDFEQIVNEHARKVKEGDKLHMRIQSTIEDTERRNMKRAVVSTKWESQRLKQEEERTKYFASEPIIRFLTNYNTVESVLLVSAVLVNLAGIMFLSSRFEGESLNYYRQEYELLGVLSVVLVSLSVVYFALVLGYELLSAFKPQQAVKCISMISCGKRRVDISSMDGRKRRRSTSVAMESDNDFQTQSNPLAGVQGKPRKSSDDGKESPDDSSKVQSLENELKRAYEQIRTLKRDSDQPTSSLSGMYRSSSRRLVNQKKRVSFEQTQKGYT
eukprot:gb/GECG01015507.1/.p1 GENE.gb/GECG01015507.1/~~gb/GECG01015507.1/.p1  ORF type:complete len:3818 (+),score=398.83 gb/GECG01015507.1/:1-11454(+)